MLSQYFVQHGKNLRQADPSALYKTGSQSDVVYHRIVNFTHAVIVSTFIESRFRYTVLFATGGIQILLLYLALLAPVIFGTSADGFLAPMSLPAAERTAKIIAACIPWMGEKQDLAMPAPCQAFSEVRLFFENRSKDPIILRNGAADLFLAVPVKSELKVRPYLYYKKAKCSLMSLMYLGIPSLSLFCLAIKLSTTGVLFL